MQGHNARFYTMTHVLPYVDFCIALLCSSSYSLNHDTATCIPPRVFTAAWRSIDVASKLSTGDVENWLKKYIKDRTGKGYANAFGLDMAQHTDILPLPV